MDSKINKIYFAIPVVYAVVIIFLLYMQFSGSRSFTVDVAGISMSGKTHKSAPGNDEGISDLSVICNGIEFTFDKENPLLVFTYDGLTHKTKALDYSVTANGISISLTKKITLGFFYNENNEDLIHISVTAADPESIRFIKLPIKGIETEINAIEDVPAVSIFSETSGTSFLSLPATGRYDSDSGMIVIYPEETGASKLTFEKAAASGVEAYAYWLRSNNEPISEERLKKVVSDYISSAAKVLTERRFNPIRGNWTNEAGESIFTEEALVMSATERIGSPSYKTFKEQLDKSSENKNKQLSKLSSSLFGNIVNSVWVYNEVLLKKPDIIKNKAINSDLTLFDDQDLIPVVMNAGAGALTDSLVKLIEKSEKKDLSIERAVSVLSFYAKLQEINPSLALKFSDIETILEDKILPSVKVFADNLFIVDEENVSNAELSLKTGSLLLKISENGSSDNDETYEAIGRELINSVLKMSSDSGFLPETITVNDAGEMITEGSIAPEEVYPFLTDNTYYPSEDYFYEETGEKISVINQADNFKMEKTENGYKMSFSFPVGRTHMFAIRNIKPFYQLNLLGYKWNPDHRFLNYSSGWWYDRQHNTLFLKVRHRDKTEEITILTNKPSSNENQSGSSD